MLTSMLSTRSGIGPIAPGEIPFVTTYYKDESYIQIAIATVLCYDTITTFDKEIEYFWSAPRKCPSVIYFVNRYVGFFTVFANVTLYCSFHTNPRLCDFSTWASNLGDWTTIVLIDYIFLMRVVALWSEAKKLAMYLKVLFAVESAFMLGNLISSVIMKDVTVGQAAGFAFCGSSNTPSPILATLYWATPFLFELILMFLALYKAMDFWRELAGFRGLGLVKVLIQDQVFYFVLIMMCSVAHITAFWLDPQGSSSTAVNVVKAVFTSTTFSCIVACRLLVHLNEAVDRGVIGGTGYRVGSMSDIQFVR